MSPSVFIAAVAGALFGTAMAELISLRAATLSRRPRPSQASDLPRASSSGGILHLLVGLSRSFGGLGSRLPEPRELEQRLLQAGLSGSVTPSEMKAVNGAIVTVGGASCLFGFSLGGFGLAVICAIGSATALLIPRLVVEREIAKRSRAISRELPDAIDLLRVALAGERSVAQAMHLVSLHSTGVLAGELRSCAGDVQLGVPLARALQLLEGRCPTDGASALVALLVRAHLQGRDCEESLSALAWELRERRSRQAIDAAAKAAPKVQLVVALVLVPSVMLLIAAGMLQMHS